MSFRSQVLPAVVVAWRSLSVLVAAWREAAALALSFARATVCVCVVCAVCVSVVVVGAVVAAASCMRFLMRSLMERMTEASAATEGGGLSFSFSLRVGDFLWSSFLLLRVDFLSLSRLRLRLLLLSFLFLLSCSSWWCLSLSWLCLSRW